MKHYPYIVYRYGPGIYGNAAINFVDDESLLSVGTGITIHWESDVFDGEGKITPKCREALRAFGLNQKEKSRFRLCLVYGPNDCDYFEPGGVINPSIQPPSSTMTLSDGEYESELGIDSGRLDLKLIKIDESANIGVTRGNRKHGLNGAAKLLAILIITSTVFSSGCLTAGAESSNGYTNGKASKTNCFPTSRGHAPTSERESRTKNSNPTASCRDGWLSYSASRSGTCSHHGGVEKWLGRNLK